MLDFFLLYTIFYDRLIMRSTFNDVIFLCHSNILNIYFLSILLVSRRHILYEKLNNDVIKILEINTLYSDDSMFTLYRGCYLSIWRPKRHTK